MERKKIKADYDPIKIQREMMDIVRRLYVEGSRSPENEESKNRSLRSVAEELDISVSKVVKLLITSGVYKSDLSEKIQEMYDEGECVQDIQSKLGISRATVHSYLPYRKGIYSAKETSVNADRIRLYRKRAKSIEDLASDICEDCLWDAVVAFQKYPFYTVNGLKYTYVLKEGRDGSLNRELLISRRTESKTLSWSSVVLALNKALEMQGQVIDNLNFELMSKVLRGLRIW